MFAVVAYRVRALAVLLVLCAAVAPTRAEAPTRAAALGRAARPVALPNQEPTPVSVETAPPRIDVVRRDPPSVPLKGLAATLFVLLNVTLLRRRRTIDSWSSC
jgi:hypothetical protein